MKFSMTVGEFVKLLKPYSNSPVTLNRLTLPFGIISNSLSSDTLLMGHVLDELASRLAPDQVVDCLDVVATAYELGHEPAGDFLDDAPAIMARMARDHGVLQMH